MIPGHMGKLFPPSDITNGEYAFVAVRSLLSVVMPAGVTAMPAASRSSPSWLAAGQRQQVADLLQSQPH